MSLTKVSQSMISGPVINLDDFVVGDGIANDTSAVQAVLDSLVSGQTLSCSKSYKIVAGLTLTNKSNIRITGSGHFFLSGAASGAYLIQLVGTIDKLEIDTLELSGDNNSGYTQCAIGCNSGQTVSNTRFHGLEIYGINVGISNNADLGGSWTNAWVYDNYIHEIVGTVSGSGYGIQMANCYAAHVYGNTLDNCSRHAIYVAKGYNLAAIITDNIIKNHRKDVATGTIRPSISCSRCSVVTISNNKFINGYDGAIVIDHDTSSGFGCSDINVVGNTFTGRKNVTPDIVIGEQAVPGSTYNTFKVSVVGNTFDTDAALSTGSIIYVLNGTEINIQTNRFRAYNVTTTFPICVELGGTYTTADAHIANISVQDNIATSDALSGGSRFSYVGAQLCTGASTYWLKNNALYNIASEWDFAATPVNLNSKLKFKFTLTNDFASIAAGVVGTYVFTVIGVKPTSNVTGKVPYAGRASFSSPYLYFWCKGYSKWYIYFGCKLKSYNSLRPA